jgi:hypothetical protein
MAASPQFKTYSETGEYVAAFRYADDAASFVSTMYPGGSVRAGHSAKLTLYKSPTLDEQDAGTPVPSYDELAVQVAQAIAALGLLADGSTNPNRRDRPMTTQTELAIMVNHDGDNQSGVFLLYPANEESEPEKEFKACFYYGPGDEYETRDEARQAAESEAFRVACRIGGQWFTNER